MLRRVLNFELSSDLSDTYASGLEVVVVSVVDVTEVVGDGAGDALALFEGVSPAGEVMLMGLGGKEWDWEGREGVREGGGGVPRECVVKKGVLLFNIEGLLDHGNLEERVVLIVIKMLNDG